MRHSIFLMNPIGSVEKTWGSFLNEAYLRRTYLRGRMHVLARTVARTCGDGCNALRLRGAKLELKSSVLFWMKEKAAP